MVDTSISLSNIKLASLREFLEVAPDAMLVVDTQGNVVQINDQALRLFGYTEAELLHHSVDLLVPDAGRGRHAAHRGGFFQAHETCPMGAGMELVGRHKDGGEFPVEISLSPMPYAHEIFVATVRDISETRRVVRELRESREYNRGLIESNIDALLTTDPLGLITDVNRMMCEMTGFAREQLIGAPFNRYFTDPRQADAGIRKVLAEDRVTNYELTMRSRAGKETVVSYNATTFRDADGRLKGVFAAARDISDQKRLEGQITRRNTELTETTIFLNNVLESSTEYSIIAKDLEGNVLTWNEGARRNYGYTAEEMVGKGNTSLLHTPEDLAGGRVKALFEQALTTGKAEGVFERRRKSGERFTASVSMTLRRDAAGAPIGYLLISKDITEQKRLEEQLRRKNEELEEQYRRVREANRLKSEFLANMSHELRTPLNAIIGFSELMHDGKVGPVSDDHKEYLGDILTSARHLLQLINDVLDLAKVESGKMEFYPEPVDLTKVIGEVRDVLRTLISRKRIEVDIVIDAALTGIVADGAKLKQVLYNYLSNALKFTADGGRVSVRATPEGTDCYRIEVEDTGIGIKAEDMKRLFVEFQQLDAGTAKKYQGTGLGLALTRRIVEAQDGHVGVDSALDKGSTFLAVLPRVMRAGTETEPVPVPAAPPGAPRLLVVEDTAREREWLLRVLRDEGYEVQTASGGIEALAHCHARRFDAILLHVLLPGITGWDVLKDIRAKGPNRQTPVIVVSVSNDASVEVFTLHGSLTKPVEGKELLRLLQGARVDNDHGRVLVVDDDPDALKLMDKSLRDLGYRPLTAAGGRAGLNAAERERPDAVILDLLMPDIDGFEFLRAFRRLDRCADVPVMIWSEQDLASAEHARLYDHARTIVAKDGEEGMAALLNELRKHLTPPSPTPTTASPPS